MKKEVLKIKIIPTLYQAKMLTAKSYSILMHFNQIKNDYINLYLNCFAF